MSDTFASMPEIPDDLIDQLLAGQPLTAEAMTGPEGRLKQLTKRLVERAMSAELADHLGYQPGEHPPAEQIVPKHQRRFEGFDDGSSRSTAAG